MSRGRLLSSAMILSICLVLTATQCEGNHTRNRNSGIGMMMSSPMASRTRIHVTSRSTRSTPLISRRMACLSLIVARALRRLMEPCSKPMTSSAVACSMCVCQKASRGFKKFEFDAVQPQIDSSGYIVGASFQSEMPALFDWPRTSCRVSVHDGIIQSSSREHLPPCTRRFRAEKDKRAHIPDNEMWTRATHSNLRIRPCL